MPHVVRLPRKEFKSRGYRAVRTPFFSLKTKGNQSKNIRLGIVVGKSVEKTAVKRNFWKRQARAILGKSVPPGNDAIIILQPGVRELTKKQFHEALIKAITQS